MADLCAAPGSKTLQLLDLMNMGRSSGLTLIAKINSLAHRFAAPMKTATDAAWCKVACLVVFSLLTTITGRAVPRLSVAYSSTPTRHDCCGCAEMRGMWLGRGLMHCKAESTTSA